jgi:signal-transduction protein with cAMP-binding, CBS, and nucleotidyltransferase domain
MSPKNLRNFFLSIVLPTILAIVFFIIAFIYVILPIFENNLMDRKKEMIHELTNTAWSLMKEYDDEYESGKLSIEEAKKIAAEKIGLMRYGSERKDYFWIIDFEPKMIMHPYRKELIGKDLNEYKDAHDKKLFVEAANIVKNKNEGYIDYMWQWKDDSTRIVPKLSYVKAFKQWEWIIGTGIYLEDVKDEMKHIKGRLFRISLIIVLIISGILIYIVRQSLKIEHKRKETEDNLKKSRQKYQSLVEAAVDGTIMLVNEKVIFSNNKFNQILDCSPTSILNKTINDIFELDWKTIEKQFEKPGRSLTFETKIKCKEKEFKEVVITVSKVLLYAQETFIIVTKDITKQRKFEKQTKNLSDELQTSLLLMHQPIKSFIKPILTCDISTSIYEAARKMQRKNQKAIFVKQNNDVLGVINDADMRNRVIAANIDLSFPVFQIMSSPVVSIYENDLLYEAVLKFKNHRISHLLVKNSMNEIVGVFSNQDALDMQRNTLSYLIKEIEIAETIADLKNIYNNVPVIVRSLVENGDKTSNITKIITSVADAITIRVIELTIEEIGSAPCRFAFIGLGSVGRKEQTLATDQDNAIIFDDSKKDDKESLLYFEKFANKVNSQLDKIGYSLCKGDVMARNPKWNQPISIWKNYFIEWINNADPQSVLDASIFFDFRCIYGDEQFTISLKNHIDEIVENKAVFFQHLATSVSSWKSPGNLFGSILSGSRSENDDTFDVKKVLLPVTSFIRLYSIKENVSETNSLKRLNDLQKNEIIKTPMYDELKLAYNYLMLMRFRSQASQLLDGEKPNNLINISKLTDIEVATIKKVFSQISELQTKVNFDFKGTA